MADVDPADYDALVVPGGRAPEYLRQYEEVLYRFNPPLLRYGETSGDALSRSDADVLDGYEISSYPAVQPEVEAAG